ncbi:MAG: peptidoglycan DD-metalloendopeptidase family protein [Longimicrobiales bacterium]|nr:peptidoglycan DD-metalloendopeptidase family protein [Longimicrobiales bacterium]
MRGRLVRLAALLVIGLGLLADPAAAQQDTLQAAIRESQQRLQQIRQERTELQQEMQQLQGQARDISRELTNIERQVDASAEALEELDYQTAALAASVDDITQRLVRTRDRLQERRVVLSRRLRSIYKQGPLHTVRVLLSAESFGDLLNRYKYLHLMSVHDQMLVGEITELERELAAQESTLTASLTEIERLRAEKLSEFAQLQYLEQSRALRLENVQTQVSAAERRIRQLEEDERRLTRVMAQLERERLEAERRRAAAGLAAGAGSLTPDALGELPWPVDGELVYRFGPESRPNGVTLRRNGIGIAAEPGTPVHAVRSGTVVVASAMEGFGNGVVLSHGAGYYTLYLYLAELRVQEGQDVATGQPLGTVGAGPEEGPHVYLQIHAPVRGRTPVPVDPLPWLRARP